MGEPKGKLVTPVADNPDDELRSLEVDANDNLKVADQSDKLTSSELNLDAEKDLQVDVKTAPTTIVKPHADEKLFGIESVISKIKTADATGTTLIITSDDVPAGKIWKITYVCAWNEDGDIATGFVFSVMSNAAEIRFHRKMTSTALKETIDKKVELYLDVDDYIRAYFDGVASPETCYLNIFGYEMNAPGA